MDSLFILVIGMAIGYTISYFMFALTEIIISRQVEEETNTKIKDDKERKDGNIIT